MYKARTQEEILTELLTLSQLPTSTIEGSFQYDIYSSNAIEFAKVELEISEMYESAFGRSSWEEYLDLTAESHGVVRRTAVRAIGTVNVKGNGLVLKDSIFSTNEGIRFKAVRDTKVIESAMIEVEAIEAGAKGNVNANTIINIPLSIPGIRAVTNDEPTHDGYDAEDDDTFRERFLAHIRLPRTSGNIWNYYDWARSIEGVGDVLVIRTWAGADTVKVVITNADLEPASEYLIEKVANAIEEQRPIGAIVTVCSVKPKPIDISAKIVGILDELEFKAGLKNYFERLTKLKMKAGAMSSNSLANYRSEVSIAQIGSVIIVEGGADDYHFLTLNGGVDNIKLDYDELPVINSLNFTF